MTAAAPAMANPDEYSGGALLPSAIVMACLSTSAVLLRFLSRRVTRVPLMWDDWLILAALPFSLLECAIDIEGNFFNHFGWHIETATPDEFRNFFVTTYIFQLSYGFAVTLPKFSMLALFKRVFGLENFKWPLIVTTAVCIAYLIGISLAAILVCIPVSAFWDPTVKGNCIPLLPFYIGQAATNITLDVALLIIPIIPIRRLNITTSQKIAVCGIFFLGIFVTVCSAIRLHALVVTVSTPVSALDPTYYFVDAAVWSVIETNLSVVCACLPSMRPLLRAAIHGTFRSSAGRSEDPSQFGSSNRASALIRTISNRKSMIEPQGATQSKASERAAPAENVRRSLTNKSATDRAQKWQRHNSLQHWPLDTHNEDEAPHSPLSIPQTKKSSWRNSRSHLTAAIDAVAPSNMGHDRHGPRSSWTPLTGSGGRSESPIALEALPQRLDSVTVHSSVAYTAADGEERRTGMGYSCEIRGGDESERSSEEWKEKEAEAGDWEHDRRTSRHGRSKSRGRQVLEDWVRRGSKG